MQHLESLRAAIVEPKHRLLIGEHNASIREFLVSVLCVEGYEVMAASNTEDLLNMLAVSLHPEIGSGRFDLVIAEVRMLGHAGLSALSQFEDMPGGRPFVLIASFADKRLNAEAYHSALAILEDPVDIEALVRLLRRWLGGAMELAS
jgi:DNA-binding NtrC family response regulator